MEPKGDIALIGLAVMGQNLILNMNDHGYTVVAYNRTVSKVDDFLNQLQGIIQGSAETAVRGTGKFPVVTSDPEAAKKEGKYLVCKNDVLVHFGSTAARIMIGFGAGKSRLVVVPSLEDPATGEVVLKYTGWGSAPFGYGFQVLQKMQVDAMEIENYFGGLVRRVPN